MDDEFRSHIAHRADDLERRGLSREAAERAARVEFGGVEAQKDAARDARGLRGWDELRANVAFAARGVAHHPIQSLIVVTTLTLGLGISAVVFSVLNALAFRARVDRDAASFTRIFVSYRSDTSGPSFPGSVPLGDYLAYARQMRSLSPIAGWQHVQLALSAGAKPTPGALVTCGFFDVYGPVRPIAGRVLQRDDCDSRAPVAVIGNDLWRTAFGADPGAVGRVLRINGQTIRIVGVAPTFSSASTDDQIWLPYTLRGRLQLGPDDPASPNVMWLFLDGRLAPGSTRGDVLAEARVIAAQQDNVTPGRHTAVFVTNGSLVARPGNGLVVTGIVAVVFVGLACLALVACASVVSILLAIADGRRTEMALRMALGAGAPRLAAMLGTESLMLASVAGAARVRADVPAAWLAHDVDRPAADQLLARPRLARVRVPARHDGAGGARRGERADPRRPVARSQFDVASNARWNRRPRETGKRAHERRDRRSDRAPRRDDRAHSVAGTDRQFAAAIRCAPRVGDDAACAATGDGRMAEPTRRPRASAGDGERRARRRVRHGRAGERRSDRAHRGDRPRRKGADAMPSIEVSPTYFDVFGIRVERGRAFTPADADCAAAVCPVILSREAAREWWGNADPLGRRLAIDATHTLDVVGVAGDATSEIAEPVQALMVYTPWRPNARLYQPFLRVEDGRSGVVRRVASLVSERFAGAVAAPMTVEEQLTQLTDAFQRVGEVVGIMAAITAVLAIVGVYGVVALAARRRLKEMGIRLALGARRDGHLSGDGGAECAAVVIGLVVGAVVRDADGGRVGSAARAGVSRADHRPDRVRRGRAGVGRRRGRRDAGAGEAGDVSGSGACRSSGVTARHSAHARADRPRPEAYD